MSSPFENPQQVELPKTDLQEEYKRILATSVSPENVEIFFETTLQDLVALVKKATDQYRLKYPDVALEQAALEDAAMNFANIPDIQKTLEIIAGQVDLMLRLKQYIQTQVPTLDKVLVPPNPTDGQVVVAGSGQGVEQKRLIPRLLTLLYILEHDLGYPVLPRAGQTDTEPNSTNVEIMEGVITDQMMRKHPYTRVSIEPLRRAVYICDEEGNASYFFDLDQINIPIEKLDQMDKDYFNGLVKNNPRIGMRLIQNAVWREKVIEYLTEGFEEKIQYTKKSSRLQSDFKSQNEVPKARIGWKTAPALGLMLEIDSETVKRFATSFRTEHPDWFEMQQQKSGPPTEHYNPELIQIIENHFTAIPRQKDGWATARTLSNTVKANTNTIKLYADQLRLIHPEWFEVQRGKPNVAEYYHPDLIKILVDHFANVVSKKEGWKNHLALMRGLKISRSKIDEFVQRFRAENPNWFETQKPKSGQATEHYHPDLVKQIELHFPVFPEQKDGWESLGALKKNHNISVADKTIQVFVDQFRSTHPYWFEIQRPKAGPPTEHYHPKLVETIKKHFSSTSENPPGWKCASNLTKPLQASLGKIEMYVDQFRSKNPEWFQMYVGNNHRLTEYYHPQLVSLIEEYFVVTPRKKQGWQSPRNLQKLIGFSSTTIQQYADQFRSTHPDWFEIQRTSKESEQYHPELVEKVIQHFRSIPSKKEGWENPTRLQPIIHTGYLKIQTYAEQFRASHPEWFEVQKTQRQSAEFYHPDLVMKIKEHFSQSEQL